MSNKHLIIISTIKDDWGGSEELWALAVPYWIELGYTISVAKEKINFKHPQFEKLAQLGVNLVELNPEQVASTSKIAENNLEGYIQKSKVTFALISQGINFDGLGYGYICLRASLPYAMVAQKAVETFWPYNVDRVAMRNVYLNAEMAYFVSNHNLKLTEEQFGIRFKNAQVISNPVKFKRFVRPYPTTDNGYKLACIGRFFIIDKGQDILIRILSQEKWRARPLSISFIGSGIDKQGLKELAQLLDVKNVEFIDQQNDIEKLWEQYHALILPSRYEGTPLVLLEAMAFGRIGIVTNAGGNPDLIKDGTNGFIGQANESDFDRVMERAWQTREQWPELGKKACQTLIETVPELPEQEFAYSLDQVVKDESKLVTVIIPTYNRAGIVEGAIQSILNQTYAPIQLIVADDGSVDDTDSLMQKYPQVTYLKLAHGGQAHARNEGLKHARGEYVATLDSDDTWEPNFVERSLQIIEENDLDFVFSNWMQDMGKGEFVDRFSICKVVEETLQKNPANTIVLDNEALRNMYLTGCPSPSSSLLIKRSKLKRNWTSGLRIADDWCMLLDIIFNQPTKAGFTRDILWKKKIDGQNLYDGRDMYELIRDLWIHDLEFIINRFKSNFTRAEKKRIRVALSHNYLHYSYFQFRQKKNYTQGIKYTTLALLTNNRIMFQMLIGLKLKGRKALGRIKRSLK